MIDTSKKDDEISPVKDKGVSKFALLTPSNGDPCPAGGNRRSFLLEEVMGDNLCRTSRIGQYDLVS